MRVFQDRLVNYKDRHWFEDLLGRVTEDHFKMNPSNIVDENEDLLFGDFMNPESDIKLYQPIYDINKVNFYPNKFLIL